MPAPPTEPVWEGAWLELVPHFHCNSRCGFCFRPDWLKRQMMPARQAGQVMQQEREKGAQHLWVGGGEPTLWKPLAGVLQAAGRLGYARRLIQTNAWALGEPGYLQGLLQAGLTDVRVSVFATPLAEGGYDHHTATPGASALLQRGLAAAVAAGLNVEADLLMHRGHLASMKDTACWLMEQGVNRGLLWLLSLEGMTPEQSQAQALLPTFDEAAPALGHLLDFCPQAGFDLRVLHLPPCLYPTHAHRHVSALRWNLTVATPGGIFALSQSRMEGGVYVSACGACNLSARCPGLRRDYLALHGEPALTPITGDQ